MRVPLSFCLLILASPPLRGQIYSDFTTSLGNFTVELDYTNSPRTVANFITLAEGSRNWVNSANGAVRTNTPYYDGIVFHRVIAGFVNQAGSQNGIGTDGPGYAFPDEVSNGLTFSSPYLIAMANSGPNTNGSQFFITVDTPTSLDGVHTIFGSVSSGTSVIDAINAVTTDDDDKPVTDVTINSVTIRRVGAAAIAFDASSQILPAVQGANPTISFPTGTATLNISQAPRSSLSIYASPDLLTWTPEIRYLDTTRSTQNSFDTGISEARHFFATSSITWPTDAHAPDTYLGRNLTLIVNGSTLVLDANPPGSSTIGTLSLDGGTPSTVTELRHETTQGYGSTILVFSEGFVPIRFNLGYDSTSTGRVTGTAFATNPFSLTGTFTLAP
jgi:cyclophilin family peptidyl-prolyl cis-trans isomerase